MSFNANTYRMNKWRKSAWINLAEARAIKQRVNEGIAYEWEISRIAMFVKLARIDMRLYLSARELKETE